MFFPGDEIRYNAGSWMTDYPLRGVIIGPADEPIRTVNRGWVVPVNCYKIGHSMNDPNSYTIFHEKWIKLSDWSDWGYTDR